MKKWTKIVAFVCMFTCIFTLFGYSGRHLSVDVQIALIGYLLNSASVVIGVTGIWLAVVFPEVIKDVYIMKTADEKRLQYQRSKVLLTPFLLAVGAAVFMIAIRVIVEPLRYLDVDMSLPVAQGILFGILAASSCWVIYTLVLAALPGLKMLFDAKLDCEGHEIKERFFSSTSVREKDEDSQI